MLRACCTHVKSLLASTVAQLRLFREGLVRRTYLASHQDLSVTSDALDCKKRIVPLRCTNGLFRISVVPSSGATENKLEQHRSGVVQARQCGRRSDHTCSRREYSFWNSLWRSCECSLPRRKADDAFWDVVEQVNLLDCIGDVVLQ